MFLYRSFYIESNAKEEVLVDSASTYGLILPRHQDTSKKFLRDKTQAKIM